MKIRFELNSREAKYEDIITFDFSQVIKWRGYEDTTLAKILNPSCLYNTALYLINTPIEEWEIYEEEEPRTYQYHFTKEDKIIFSVAYYREWKNGDRKYQLFIDGIAKESSRLYANMV